MPRRCRVAGILPQFLFVQVDGLLQRVAAPRLQIAHHTAHRLHILIVLVQPAAVRQPRRLLLGVIGSLTAPLIVRRKTRLFLLQGRLVLRRQLLVDLLQLCGFPSMDKPPNQHTGQNGRCKADGQKHRNPHQPLRIQRHAPHLKGEVSCQ